MLQAMLTISTFAPEREDLNLLSVKTVQVSHAANGAAGSSICKIALEEHVGFKRVWKYSNGEPPVEWWQNLEDLEDLADRRIAETRVKVAQNYGVDFMILSITGSTQDMKDVSDGTSVKKFKQWNRKFFKQISAANDASGKPHLGGFCILPLWDPQASISQFADCLKLGSLGALINGYDTSNTGGDFNYYITKEYDPFWAFVEKSGKPIYLHPREAESKGFFTQFPEMRVSPWGFHVETAEHVLRFILASSTSFQI